MSDWNEVRRLQAELERVQSASTAFRLSEVNCVEIVKKLTELKLISLLYTTDGKEFIVQEHLEKEIRNEIEANKGRIEVIELQQILNVDINHINRGVDNIVRYDESFERIPGEVITSSYKVALCTEINEMLLQNGFVSLSDLSSTFSLPLYFITKCVEDSLSTLINGQLDKSGSGLLYTESYVSRHRSRLRGLFSAMTQPTPIPALVTEGKYHERLFHSTLNELISSGDLSGSVHGRGMRAIFIPAVYSQMQNQWVDRFLDDNGYLEYDALVRMGIESPQVYIKTRYKDRTGDLMMLKSCCIGQSVISEIEANVEDTVVSQSQWIDIMSVLPSPCTDEDGELLLQRLYSNEERFLISETILSHQDFVRNCLDIFKSLIEEKAAKAAATSGSFLRQVSQESKKDGGAVGGGGGGKKGGKGKKGKAKRDEGDDSWEIIFMSKEKIAETILEKFEQTPQSFAETISNLLYRPLQERFESEARSMLAQRAEGEAGSQRKRHSELQERLQQLWNRLRLFEKGIEVFEGDTKVQLSKYLLHTICTDLTNQLLRYIAQDYKITVPEDEGAFNKERTKLVGKLPDAVRKLAQAVNSSLSEKEVAVFVSSFEALCDTESCGVMLKKLDKKKEKQVIINHVEELKANLKDEQDPAMSLHLVTLLLFQAHTGCLLHVPGRLIPRVISLLRSHMTSNDFAILDTYQSLVVLDLKKSTASQSEGEGDENEDKSKLEIDSNLFEEEAESIDQSKEKVSESSDDKGGVPVGDAPAAGGSIREQLDLKMGQLKDLVFNLKK
ncbi:PREDICTED: E3 UFM1-protein ligase 1-like [Amphimedon queenslandica]|uniref:E3 UFM1-protein ligase 1 homolog n=1 Tax=Amphimedon queenslandica TaxID=400682 RepID=A0A1X7V0M0_AMPQE|nr:PREDICTED: E3 UFM1-protein ligase 1-like [Amphimedon queenslandica]|eukprot:XP_011403614.1 PREDICTED: E3 UFM1-protein ligase 1-like [Amphimedon queenslandica]